MQIMQWIYFTKNDAAPETVMKTPLSRHWMRDLLLPRLLSGHFNLKEN